MSDEDYRWPPEPGERWWHVSWQEWVTISDFDPGYDTAVLEEVPCIREMNNQRSVAKLRNLEPVETVRPTTVMFTVQRGHVWHDADEDHTAWKRYQLFRLADGQLIVDYLIAPGRAFAGWRPEPGQLPDYPDGYEWRLEVLPGRPGTDAAGNPTSTVMFYE